MTPVDPAQTSPALPPRTHALALRQANELQAGVGRTNAPDVPDEGGLDLRALLRMLAKHKLAIASAALLGLVVAGVFALTRTPQYESVVTLQINSGTARILEFNKNIDAAEGGFRDGMTQQQTDVELLRSRSLAERVIDDLGMDPSRGRLQGTLPPSPLPGASAPSAAVMGDADVPLRAPSEAALGGAEAPVPAPENAPWWRFAASLKNRVAAGYARMGKPLVTDREVLSREAVVGGLRDAMKVDPVRNSRLVRVSMRHTDPARAARIANAVARAFMAMNMERRLESSVYAKQFLEEQIKTTQARLEESEKQLNQYTRANSILTLDDKTNVLQQTFSDYAAALSKAEQERVRAESLYNEIARDPENSPQVLDSKIVGTYKEQRARLEAEYLQNLSILKPEFPKMQQLKAQGVEIDLRIKAEINAVLASVKSQLEAARQQEQKLRARADSTRQEVLTSQDRGMQLNLLKREMETNRQLYDNLLQRLKEVGVAGGVTTNNILVADPAVPPLFPFSPNIPRTAMLGLLGGILLGLAYAFIREQMDDSIKHPDELEAQFGLPLLGVVPHLSRKAMVAGKSPALQAVDDPRGSFAEAYRSMRTALQFSTHEGAPQQLLVTSSVQSEGKSTTALALAINFAQMGKRVLLVDADMRNPSLHKSLDLPNSRGLSNYLAGEGTRQDLIHATHVAGLSLLTAGPMPPSPVDLLMGPKLFRLLDRAGEMGFDQVIVDAPPMLGIADAIVLGNQIQAILFVVKAGSTHKSSIRDALRRMRLAGLVPLGVALTQTSSLNSAYYGYESYYGYGYGKKGSSGKDTHPAALSEAR